MPTHLHTFLAAALVGVLLVAAPAFAADERPVDLPLKNGKTMSGVVQSANSQEVVLSLGPDSVRRIPWTQLAPIGIYRVKAALAPAADGDARKKLAELAADFGLYVEARVEYEKALALGAMTKSEFQRAVHGAEVHAVTQGVNHARRQAESGDLEGALDTATTLRMHFAGAPNANEINKLVNDLLELVQKLDREAAADQVELDRAMGDLKKNKEILRRKTEALQQFQKGRELAEQAAVNREKGNVTRAKNFANDADANFTKARRNFGRLRRILPRDSDMRKEVLAKLVELDKAQFDLLFETAWFMWGSRIYSHAEEYAARAAYIDPVHPELMELRDELVSSRIRYRVSDMTNARGIVR